MAKLGLNFRESSGYVTDPSGTTYALPQGVANYPTTRGGLTFGTLVDFQFDARDRNSGNDARIAGMMFSGATGQQYRIDLPDGAGDYDIWCALGDASSGGTYGMLIKDGAGSTLATITGTTTGNDFIDATNTLLSAANWPGSNASTQLTFTATYMILEAPANQMRLAHIALEKVTGGGSTTITADQGSYTLTGQDAGLRATRVLTAEFGTYALTGQTAVLQKDTPGAFTLQVDAGSYSWNGQDALADYAMNAEMGSFALTGQEVTFSIGVPAAYTLSVDPGYYAYTGRNARLDWSGAPIVPNRQAGIYMGMRIGL